MATTLEDLATGQVQVIDGVPELVRAYPVCRYCFTLIRPGRLVHHAHCGNPTLKDWDQLTIGKESERAQPLDQTDSKAAPRRGGVREVEEEDGEARRRDHLHRRLRPLFPDRAPLRRAKGGAA